MALLDKLFDMQQRKNGQPTPDTIPMVMSQLSALGQSQASVIQSLEKSLADGTAGKDEVKAAIDAMKGQVATAEAVAQLAARVEDLAKALSVLPDVFPKPEKVDIPDHSKELRNIQRLIGRIPKPDPVDFGSVDTALNAVLVGLKDLGGISKQLDELRERVDAPMVVEDRAPREWAFEFEYKDFGNEIERVVAKELS